MSDKPMKAINKKPKKQTGPSEAARAPGATAAISQSYRDLAEQRQIDIHTILCQGATIKKLTAENFAQEWFTVSPKNRTKERLIYLFSQALNQNAV